MKRIRVGDLVMYGGRYWTVVDYDSEVDQVRIRRSAWDRAAGTRRTIYATPTTPTLKREKP